MYVVEACSGTAGVRTTRASPLPNVVSTATFCPPADSVMRLTVSVSIDRSKSSVTCAFRATPVNWSAGLIRRTCGPLVLAAIPVVKLKFPRPPPEPRRLPARSVIPCDETYTLCCRLTPSGAAGANASVWPSVLTVIVPATCCPTKLS